MTEKQKKEDQGYLLIDNNIKIPQVGFGVYQIKSGKETEDAVKYALEAGYRHIDTAKLYDNEESVGKAIIDSGIPRSDIFLTTKLWNDDIRKGFCRQAFEESLSKLKTDYVDLYLIHWPVVGFDKAWTEMEKLYEEGKIKSIGVSNFHEHHFKELEKTARIMPTVNQIESNPRMNNEELIDYCKKKGIIVQIYSPLGGTGGNLLLHSELLKIADKYSKSAAQIVIRWGIQRQVVVIPKSTHRNRIIDNINVFDFELEEEDMIRINKMNQNIRVGPDPDDFNF